MTYQGFGLLLVFVIVELVSPEHEPTGVPSLDKAPLLPQPPTPDDIVLDLAVALASPMLWAAVGHSLVLHE